MKIKILCVGKIKESYLKEAIEEYSKRISSYVKLSIVEVKDEHIKESASQKDIENTLNIEGERVKRHIKDEYVISLVINGKELSSIELARKIEELPTYGNSNIVFIIGGSYGLSKEIISNSDLKLSFSKLTYPHQLMRVILLEQLYRSFRINSNEPYHK